MNHGVSRSAGCTMFPVCLWPELLNVRSVQTGLNKEQAEIPILQRQTQHDWLTNPEWLSTVPHAMLCLLQSQQLTPLGHRAQSLKFKFNMSFRRGSWKLQSTIQDPETPCWRLSFSNLRNKRQRLRRNGELVLVYDMGCLSVRCEYVLLPLVNKEADLANSQAE